MTAPTFVAPAVPEPRIVAEAGVTTSEWLALTRYCQQLLVAGTTSVLGWALLKLGLHVSIPPELLYSIVGLEISGAVAIGQYAIGRGIRKAATHGTPDHPQF